MMMMKGFGLVLAVLIGLGAAAAPAEAQYRALRKGTVSLGGGGGFGWITGESRYGLDFDSGGGYHIDLKYSVKRNIALGFHFQNQSYNWIEGSPLIDETPIETLTLTTFEGQAFFYRNRGTDASQYLMVGIGIYRPELRRSGDTAFPPEDFMFTAGVGTELFIRENWALDLQLRGIGYLGEGITDQEVDVDFGSTSSISFGLQLQAGILYYLLK